MVNGTNELAYKGVTAPKPPNLIQVKKAPTTRDTEHELGTLKLPQRVILSMS